MSIFLKLFMNNIIFTIFVIRLSSIILLFFFFLSGLRVTLYSGSLVRGPLLK